MLVAAAPPRYLPRAFDAAARAAWRLSRRLAAKRWRRRMRQLRASCQDKPVASL